MIQFQPCGLPYMHCFRCNPCVQCHAAIRKVQAGDPSFALYLCATCWPHREAIGQLAEVRDALGRISCS